MGTKRGLGGRENRGFDPALSVPSAFHARFGGLDWTGDLPFVQFDSALASESTSGVVALGRRAESRIGAPLRTIGRASIAAEGLRFDCGDEVSFDCEGGTGIGWVPGPEWRGVLPVSFYSSVAAITLAMRGMLPLHASSVVLYDRAWLLAGASGAGKSTLTAELLKAGARLLADDLTPLTLAPTPAAWRGRPALRLHPDSCAGMAIDGSPEPTDDGRGKLLVRPASRAADKGWPVGGILLLADTLGDSIGPGHRAMAYGTILFRPRILTALPQRAEIRANLLALAREVPMAVLPPVRGFDDATQLARVAHTLATIARLAAQRAAPAQGADAAR